MCFLSTISREKALFINQRSQDYKRAIQGKLGWRAQGEGVQIGLPLTTGPLVLPPVDTQQDIGTAQSLWSGREPLHVCWERRRYGNDVPSCFFPKRGKKQKRKKETQSRTSLHTVPLTPSPL